MRTDEELKKTFTVELGADGIIRTVLLEPLPDMKEDAWRAKLHQDMVMEILNRAQGDQKFLGIIDLRPLKNSRITTPGEAGKIYSETAQDPRVGKIAIIGTNPLYKALAKFILLAAHKGGQIGVFSNEEEALAWFRETKAI